MTDIRDNDVRFSLRILNVADSARYLGISATTLGRWTKPGDRGDSLIHVREAPLRKASVPFIGLTEAFVLNALRAAGVRLHKIRPALTELQRRFGTEYALVSPNLATDGVSVLWDFARTHEGSDLIDSSGQHVFREIVSDYLQYVTWGEDQLPTQLQLRWEPSKIVVNPRIAFGQPRFGDSGPRVADVAAMLKSGETAEVVGDEFGISTEDVRTAARILLGRAA
ncbi:DUF433 domain-containing protein [Nocardia sp. BMG51109]|uniref:DUF433 domain-containing protein n=1 Tax=Nocardia sp. BMG51109 TaxID=1056816 RepID=UPI000463DA02|nr:DUF433 domain-containing protein [Nocardia sp. BMG51109]